MDLAGFWALIERSAQETADPVERGDWLAEALTGLTDEELIDFQDHLDAQMDRVGSWSMWHAASLIQDGCSDDGFSGFRAWLVGLGPVVVDGVADDPDGLADQPEVQRLAGRHPRTWAEAEWPYWEELEFVAVHEYERRHGGCASIHHALTSRLTTAEPVPQPVEEGRWDHHDLAESRRRLPRLAAMFPQAGPSQATAEAAQASLMQAQERLERQLAGSGRTLAEFFRGMPPRTP
ncbi:DUF4240 domain-containing protein [Dactylosporangium sp. NPDC049742]|uniref:DUF4240 domain-containing protein n=1 Tax=Dactylosporangium sp. NPDC049742 TaxID=3154737 RepID=UPI00342AB1B5